MESYKGRTVSPQQLVEVYRNLHTGNYSIRDAKTGHVLGHAETVQLSACSFVVSVSGRERVRKEKRKAVHAFVRGFYESSNTLLPAHIIPVTYNPYYTDTFQVLETGEPIWEAETVYCEGKYVYLPEGIHHANQIT
ncbi:hypothetical protein ACFYKX_11160 [Cytobacillus sp. FJAT-54145]|uniref:Uncharacterized protein n=1 Tax=Cytobacillus spartinae TaxID=3299023 RepID=A0ABW6KEB8_9BACI